jgi:hypothetical protein
MDRITELQREINHATNALFDCDMSSKNEDADSLMNEAYQKVLEALNILLSERNEIKMK